MQRLSVLLVVIVSLSVASAAAGKAPASSQWYQPRAVPTVHDTQVVDGHSWSVSTYPPTANGLICGGLHSPTFQEFGCSNPNTMFANSPIVVRRGAGQQKGDPTRWAHIWVYGYAAPSVVKVEILLTNCTTVPLRVDSSGVFLYVDATQAIAKGVGPQKLIATGANGTVLTAVGTLFGPPQGAPKTNPGKPTAIPGATAPIAGSCPSR